MALLFVPTHQVESLCNHLATAREKRQFFHELKFSGLNPKTRGAKSDVARAWTEAVVADGRKPHYDFRFRILGIDRDNLRFSEFGAGDGPARKYATVYNRFFRSQLIGGVKFFYPGGEEIVVDAIYHDSEGHLEAHDYFSWHSIARAEMDLENVVFQCERIDFVTSDPRHTEAHPLHSELIQFTDVLLGAVSHCVECPNPRHIGQRIASEPLAPLVRRMLQAPQNIHSGYGYHRRFDLSYFPSSRQHLGGSDLDGMLYRNRRLAIDDVLSGQQRLLGVT